MAVAIPIAIPRFKEDACRVEVVIVLSSYLYLPWVVGTSRRWGRQDRALWLARGHSIGCDAAHGQEGKFEQLANADLAREIAGVLDLERVDAELSSYFPPIGRRSMRSRADDPEAHCRLCVRDPVRTGDLPRGYRPVALLSPFSSTAGLPQRSTLWPLPLPRSSAHIHLSRAGLAGLHCAGSLAGFGGQQ